MRAVIQRVRQAQVTIGGKVIGKIKKGLVVLLAIHRDDARLTAVKMAERIVKLRLFNDGKGKMNLSIKDVGGEMLVISQFTLYADCSRGNRPSFLAAAAPDSAHHLYLAFVESVQNYGVRTESGQFGALMAVKLVNDGPVTIFLDINQNN